MKTARDRVLRTEWLPVSSLVVAQYYGELFPLPRDWGRLRQSFKQHRYKPEYPIVTRVLNNNADIFEVVCGVGRYTVAKERGMRRVPVIIRQFDGDTQAQAYAIEDNLYNPAASTCISLVHAISLARALKACGGIYTPQRIWEFARVSESTFWRAVSSLDSTLQEVTHEHPEIAALSPSQQTAEIVRRDLCPLFTQLFAGEIEVHTYHKAHRQVCVKSTRRKANKPASQPRSSAMKQRNNALTGTKFETVPSAVQDVDKILPHGATHSPLLAASSSQRKKRIDKEREPFLFDL